MYSEIREDGSESVFTRLFISSIAHGSQVENNYVVNQSAIESTEEIQRFIIRESGLIREESENNESQMENNVNHQEARELLHYPQFFYQEEERQPWHYLSSNKNLLSEPQTRKDLFLKSPLVEDEEEKCNCEYGSFWNFTNSSQMRDNLIDNRNEIESREELRRIIRGECVLIRGESEINKSQTENNFYREEEKQCLEQEDEFSNN